jgi:hypothetical protein
MDYETWKVHLCGDQQLYENANGLLLSYMWLICHKSDLKIAHDTGLLAPKIVWERWTAFSKTVLSHIDHEFLRNVNPRYLYGELRLGRLNQIYRLCSQSLSITNLIRGYEHGYHEYSTYISRNFAWLLIAIIYITVVLTAMQVGLATTQLKDSNQFNRASYGFTVFSILAPLAGIAAVAIIVLGLVLFNLSYTLHQRGKTQTKYQHVFESDSIKSYRH